MRVLSHLEYMTIPYQQDIFDIHEKIFNEISGEKFYSQPFKPELITELFEEINYYEDYAILPYFDDDYRYSIEMTWDNYSEHNENKDYVYLHYPRTLDDFITDCQRAGIELEWKEKK